MRRLAMAVMVAGCGTLSALQAGEEPFVREPPCQESLRPPFHFAARYWDEYQLHPPNQHKGWINDLNGLVFSDGVYRLFAQRWLSAWLHAVSTDNQGQCISCSLDKGRTWTKYDKNPVRSYLETRRVKLIFLPARSPNLNLIERLWKYFRKIVMYNRYYQTLQDFLDAAEAFFTNITAHRHALKSPVTESSHLFTTRTGQNQL